VSPIIIGIIGIVVLVIVLFSRIPVGFGIFLVGFVGFCYLVSLDAGLSIIAKDVFNCWSWYVLGVCPMFVLMGYLAYESGLSEALFATAYAWVGQYRGGLAIAVTMTCAAFGAICGDPCATSASIGAVSLAEMRRYKYDMSLATACVAAGGVLGILIPPSIILLVYGIITENSIAALFLAGIIPGIMLMLLYMAVIYIQAWRNPSVAPAGPPVNLRQKLAAFRAADVVSTLAIFALTMGGLIVGWFTPTEAGAIGAFGILVVGSLVRRKLKWQGFVSALGATTRTTAFIFIIFAGVTVFGRFLAVSRIPAELGVWTTTLPAPRVVIMVAILLVYFFFGMIIDPFPFMLLTMPIFYPAVLLLGYDPIWYGVVMVFCCGVGGITPPVGVMVYVVAGIAKDVPLMSIFKGVWPFVGAIAVAVVLVIAFPQIATFLPDLIMAPGG